MAGQAWAGLAALLLLFGPGAVVLLSARVQWPIALAAAPGPSMAVVLIGSLLAEAGDHRWSVIWLLGTSLAAGAATAGLARIARITSASPQRISSTLVAAAIGGTLSMTVVVVVLAESIAPGAVAQNNDTPFHLNSVRQILDTGNASPLAFTVSRPESASSYYPGSWHGVVALVAESSRVEVPVAANATNVVIAALAWPLSAALLARVVVGRVPIAVGTCAAMAGPTAAMSHYLLNFGPLYPFHLAMACVPSLVALSVAVLRAGAAPFWPRRPTAIALGWTLVGVAAAHPSAVFTAGVALAPFLYVAAQRANASSKRPVPSWVVAWMTTIGLIALAGTAAAVASASSTVSSVLRYPQGPSESVVEAVASILLMRPAATPLQPAVAALGLLGLTLGALSKRTRPLVWAFLLLGTLYAIAAAIGGPLRVPLTGPWYNDERRIGVALAVPMVVLVGAAVDQVWRDMRRSATAGGDTATSGRRSLVAGATVVATAAVALVTATRALAPMYSFYSEDPANRERFWSSAEEDFSEELPGLVAASQLLANDPRDGSSLNYAFSGVPMLFLFHDGAWDPDRLLIARHLRDASTRPDVCAALERFGVTHAIEGTGGFFGTGRPTDGIFRGMVDLGEADGFTRVAGNKDVTLYRIDACRRSMTSA